MFDNFNLEQVRSDLETVNPAHCDARQLENPTILVSILSLVIVVLVFIDTVDMKH